MKSSKLILENVYYNIAMRQNIRQMTSRYSLSETFFGVMSLSESDVDGYVIRTSVGS
jgi:hypothetical protein